MKKIIQRFCILIPTFILLCSVVCVAAQAQAPAAAQSGGIKKILLALVCGLILAFLITLRMKGELKTVQQQHAAAVYIKKDSLRMNVKTDTFIRKELQKTERQKK